ncbi:hypothetical protein P3T76_002589 [Phytophthora citrophthora]|uniref:Uncharacterized protein n=1 Tax=Phytophthora citrophthora TaxID=4793 RepID=A0AAD9GWV8_9STRA|nr:hypothetical protein P3T76_002589 [Phytophthora citrophthora]
MGPGLQTQFGGAKSVFYTEAMQSKKTKAEMKCIHEVIMLNLTTPDYRAEFFGLAPGSDFHTCLEKVIH